MKKKIGEKKCKNANFCLKHNWSFKIGEKCSYKSIIILDKIKTNKKANFIN